VSGGLDVAVLRVILGGQAVLGIADLQVAGGSLIVVLGGAGSGKTTLAAALTGALPATGEVRLNGAALQGPPSRRRRAGLVAAIRDGRRLAGCNVIEALHLAGRGGRRASQALDRFPALATRQRVAAQLLSGGEQQILQVACSWCATPRAWILDSPTVGLAADAAQAIAELAREEAAAGCTVLWVEQDARAAPVAATYNLVRGRLVPAAV
jgi:branched-chain amino acid transport system ATP-binding protein